MALRWCLAAIVISIVRGDESTCVQGFDGHDDFAVFQKIQDGECTGVVHAPPVVEVSDEAEVLKVAARTEHKGPVIVLGKNLNYASAFKFVESGSDCMTNVRAVRGYDIDTVQGGKVLIKTEELSFSSGEYIVCVDQNADDENKTFVNLGKFTVSPVGIVDITAEYKYFSWATEVKLNVTGHGLSWRSRFALVDGQQTCGSLNANSPHLVVETGVDRIIRDIDVTAMSVRTELFSLPEGKRTVCVDIAGDGRYEDTGVDLDFGSKGVENVLTPTIAVGQGQSLELLMTVDALQGTRIKLVGEEQPCSITSGTAQEYIGVVSFTSYEDRVGRTIFFTTFVPGRYRICLSENWESFEETDFFVDVIESEILSAGFHWEQANSVFVTGTGLSWSDTKAKIVDAGKGCELNVPELSMTTIFNRPGNMTATFYDESLDSRSTTRYDICVKLTSTSEFIKVAKNLGRFELVAVTESSHPPLALSPGELDVYGIGISYETSLKLVEENQDCSFDTPVAIVKLQEVRKASSAEQKNLSDPNLEVQKGKTYSFRYPSGVTGSLKVCVAIRKHESFQDTGFTLDVPAPTVASALALGVSGTLAAIELQGTVGLVAANSRIKLVSKGKSCADTSSIIVNITNVDRMQGESRLTAWTLEFTQPQPGQYSLCVQFGRGGSFQQTGVELDYIENEISSFKVHIENGRLNLHGVTGAGLKVGQVLKLVEKTKSCSSEALYSLPLSSVFQSSVFVDGRTFKVLQGYTNSVPVVHSGSFKLCGLKGEQDNSVPIVDGKAFPVLEDQIYRVCSLDGNQLGFVSNDGSSSCVMLRESFIEETSSPSSAPTSKEEESSAPSTGGQDSSSAPSTGDHDSSSAPSTEKSPSIPSSPTVANSPSPEPTSSVNPPTAPVSGDQFPEPSEQRGVNTGSTNQLSKLLTAIIVALTF